jgi:hypothetical protein
MANFWNITLHDEGMHATLASKLDPDSSYQHIIEGWQQTYRPSGRDPLTGSFFISFEPNRLFRFLLESQFNRSTGPFGSSPVQTTLGASSTFSCDHSAMTKAQFQRCLSQLATREFVSRGSRLFLSNLAIPEMSIRVWLFLCQHLPCVTTG